MMSEEIKARLREAARRKRGRLLKDVSPEELLIACDWAEDQGCDVVLAESDLAYWKWIERWQLLNLLDRLPYRECVVASGPGGGRHVLAFRCSFCVAVCRFCGIDANKYLRRVVE